MELAFGFLICPIRFRNEGSLRFYFRCLIYIINLYINITFIIIINSLYLFLSELRLSPDVAGATFMAAGSSAPELATVIIGVFFAKDDIGVSIAPCTLRCVH